MCVRAYLNGDGSGYNTHLSLFFVIMRGEFDNLLKWPFDYKVSMILVGEWSKNYFFLHYFNKSIIISFKMVCFECLF